MAMLRARQVHDWLSYFLIIPLLTSAATGALWTVQKYWLGIEKPAQWLMKWHQGDHYFGFLAPSSERFVVDDGSGPFPNLPLTRHWRYAFFCAVGLASVAHSSAGMYLLGLPTRWMKLRGNRRLHVAVAWFLSWPLMLTVGTGIIYRLLRMHGFDNVKWIRVLHAGWLAWLLPFYPVFVCFVLVLLTGTGLAMSSFTRNCRKRHLTRDNETKAK